MVSKLTIRQPPYYRFLYNGKKQTILINKQNLTKMSEEVAKSTNWVAIITIIANAVVELVKLIFS